MIVKHLCQESGDTDYQNYEPILLNTGQTQGCSFIGKACPFEEA